jgi:3-oxoacyl-[acyl-carrier-protein] synthase III
MAWITGVGMTAFGKHTGSTTVDPMSQAATAALADADLERRDIDGLVCGYSTTMPHLMLSTLFATPAGILARNCVIRSASRMYWRPSRSRRRSS